MPSKCLICPKCGSKNTAYIIYGEPDMGYCYELGMKRKSYILGGCCVFDDLPLYSCKECDYSWGRFDGESIIPSIKSIKAYVGGFWGPNCDIEADIRRGKLKRKYVNHDNEEFIDDEVDIAPKDWQVLLRILRDTDFEYWDNKYDDPHVCDGTQWYVEIQLVSGKKIRKSGSNMFPGRWEQFCRRMSKFSGVKFG